MTFTNAAGPQTAVAEGPDADGSMPDKTRELEEQHAR